MTICGADDQLQMIQRETVIYYNYIMDKQENLLAGG